MLRRAGECHKMGLLCAGTECVCCPVFVIRASVTVRCLRGIEVIKAGMKVGDSKKEGEQAERGDVTSPAGL